MVEQERLLTGQGVSPGAAWATARVVRRAVQAYPATVEPAQVNEELERLQAAIAWVNEQLERQKAWMSTRAGEADAAILEAHQMFLADPAYVGEMQRRIREENLSAAEACVGVTHATSEMLAALPDEYLRARADDVRDVGERLLRAVLGDEQDQDLTGMVVVAEEITPSMLTGHTGQPAGLVAVRGNRTAHAAILARSLGIPAVFGVTDAIDAIADGDTILVDGDAGEVWVSPSQTRVEATRARLEARHQRQRRAQQHAHEAAVTQDGITIEVFANIGQSDEAERARSAGADGIGLMRSEFLYIDRSRWPDEEEQYAWYRLALQQMAPRPVIIRTLDIGGDKPLPYAAMAPEDNPFLGVRGLRYGLVHRDVLTPQLRALLRAAVHGNLWVMVPMVTTVDEVRTVRAIVEEERLNLQAHGVQVGEVRLGIMVETPAAAVMADVLAREVDFFSIGTNDLTQYVMAADRGNAGVAHLYAPHHPAVLRLIRQVCQAADRQGIPVGVCGELAGDPLWAPILVGLGVRELSMVPSAIAQVKELVRSVSVSAMRELADAIVTSPDAAAAETLAKDALARLLP
ncbi:MAG: phosphoenolpyruvate--protein phosphotransferase [Thermoflavifilum sp.]|nr:phosphoenolpyruvate--protein phosphotransferase [Thermoflavifilum sp.]MCL6513985.1 phosphoenolpyruvate--protein phosphotransferase [Alicyclobacillus sp.]